MFYLKILFFILLSPFFCLANSITKFPQKFDVSGHRTFVFSPVLHKFAAYDKDGYLVDSGDANGGASRCPANPEKDCQTPVGKFKVYRKGTKYCVSTSYKGPDGKRAHMPYCMFFNRDGEAIHGSDYVSDVNGSHGCIRVQTKQAEWLWKYFIRIGTRVEVLPYR